MRLALYESLKPVQRKRGRPCSTWIEIIEKDLSLVDIELNLNKTTPDETIATLEGLAEDRRKWRSLVKDIIMASQKGRSYENIDFAIRRRFCNAIGIL